MQYKSLAILSLIISLVWGTLTPSFVYAVNSKGTPPVANYFLNWDLNETQARNLAKYDVVIMDMEVQQRHPSLLRAIRQWNPEIKLLVYITPQEIRQDAGSGGGVLRRELAAGISEQWYLHNSGGSRTSWWPGTYVLNVTPGAPRVGGETLTDYMVRFVSTKLLSTGLWDGVFYDNAWDSITYFVGNDVDVNGDGRSDANANIEWQNGMKNLYRKTKEINPSAIIIGNGTTRQYQQELNGKMLENFAANAWTNTMNTYQANSRGTAAPRVNIINSNTSNTGKENLQHVRFGLGSALLEDGYFSYDHGDQNHGQTWWYDEYDVALGEPLSPSLAANTQGSYQPDIWRRDFEHGLVLVNSTNATKTVDLGGEYEKINGKQASSINDGAIVSEVDIEGTDGIILRKTVSRLDDVLFTNGQFARFYGIDGARLRNGYFLFDEAFKGGDQVLYLDVDGDGVRDQIVASGNKITATKDDGQPFFKIYPFTADYKGAIRLAVGNLDNDSNSELYVAPAQGALPIKIYNLIGEEVFPGWYPFGKKYSGGYSIAIAGKGPSGRVIIGSGKGRVGTVGIYNPGLNKMVEVIVYDKKYTGGVTVAAGDFDGNGVAEIATGFGSGTYPVLKMYNLAGGQFAPSITFKSKSFRSAGIQASDVDFNGKDDLVLLTDGTL